MERKPFIKREITLCLMEDRSGLRQWFKIKLQIIKGVSRSGVLQGT